jgi:hypothetical protein
LRVCKAGKVFKKMSTNSSGAAIQPPTTDTGINNNESNNPSQSGEIQRRRGNRQQQWSGSSARFAGSKPQMNEHIYDFVPSAGSDRFIETTRELAIYVGHKYLEYMAALVQAVIDLELVDPVKPAEKEAAATAIQIKRWEFAKKEYRVQLKTYRDFRAGLYSTVLGQCTDALCSKLKAREEFTAASQDGILLLKLIRTATHTFEQERSNLANKINKLKSKFYSLRQGKYETLLQYHRKFESLVSAMESVKMSFSEPCMIQKVAESHGRTFRGATNDDKEEARQKILANQFIRGANNFMKRIAGSWSTAC